MPCDSCDIKNLIYRYADCIDRGALREAAALFRHGRVITTDGAGREHVAEGEDAVYRMYTAFTRLHPPSGTPLSMHMTSNVSVAVAADGGTASASCYAVVFQAVEGFPLQPVIGVRYRDRFEQSASGWHFTERRLEPLLYGDLSRHLLQPVP
jgi:hypothetical protein